MMTSACLIARDRHPNSNSVGAGVTLIEWFETDSPQLWAIQMCKNRCISEAIPSASFKYTL